MAVVFEKQQETLDRHGETLELLLRRIAPPVEETSKPIVEISEPAALSEQEEAALDAKQALANKRKVKARVTGKQVQAEEGRWNFK